MLRFVKHIFISAMMLFSFDVLDVNSLECVSVNDQECKVRPEIVNINSNEPPFYLYSVKINAVLVVTIIMDDMQKCGVQILLKI